MAWMEARYHKSNTLGQVVTNKWHWGKWLYLKLSTLMFNYRRILSMSKTKNIQMLLVLILFLKDIFSSRERDRAMWWPASAAQAGGCLTGRPFPPLALCSSWAGPPPRSLSQPLTVWTAPREALVQRLCPKCSPQALSSPLPLRTPSPQAGTSSGGMWFP